MERRQFPETRTIPVEKRQTWPTPGLLWVHLVNGLFWSYWGWSRSMNPSWSVYALVFISLSWSLTAWIQVTNWRGLGNRGWRSGVYVYVQPRSRALHVSIWVVLVLVVLNDVALILLRGIP